MFFLEQLIRVNLQVPFLKIGLFLLKRIFLDVSSLLHHAPKMEQRYKYEKAYNLP